MKKFLKYAVAAAMAAGILSGCGKENLASDAQPASVNAASSKEIRASEADEGVLNLVQGPGAINMDTTTMDSVWVNRGGIVKGLMFRSLFLPDSTLTRLSPDLAKSWEISEDQLHYTIVMDEGNTWHDGEPVTADDVVWSISTILKAAQANAIYTNAFSEISGAEDWKNGKAHKLEGIKADGAVITIDLNRPVGNFLNVLGQFAILPKHLLEQSDPLELHNDPFWANPVGNGMYKLDTFIKGSYFDIVPYEGYRGRKPAIARIRTTNVADVVAAAQAGKVDFINTNAADQIALFNQIPSFKATPVDMLFYRYLVCNIKSPDGTDNLKMSDKRVRKALLMAIDRESLASSLYPDLAQVNNTGVPSGLAEYNKDSENYSYNPDQAKKMLEEAGFDFSKTLKLRYYYGDQSSIDFMTAIASYWNAIGIQVDVQKFQGDATTELFTIKDYDLALKGLSAFGYEEWYGEYASTNANFKNIFGGDTAFDEKINELNAASNPEDRAAILSDLQKLEQDNLWKLPVFTMQNVFYVNEDRVETAGEFGNPWFNYDMKFEDWKLK